MIPDLLPGDIVFVRGNSWTSRLIRRFTRSAGEAPTVVNHVGIMVGSHDIVESLNKTVKRPLNETVKGAQRGIIVRRRILSLVQRERVAEKALLYVGKPYGWLKILAHGLDHLLFGDRFVVRRVLFLQNYPICSWVVAYAYDGIGGFGVPPNEASPDDLWDFCMEGESAKLFEVVWSWGS